MTLTKSNVIHIAKLAKLFLSPQEIEKFRRQLSEVLDYINELNEIDTKGIEPTSQTTGLLNVTGKDEISPTNSLTLEQALSGTEETYNGYFKVKAVIKK